MRKLILALSLVGLASAAYAAAGVRGAKANTSTFGSTSAVAVQTGPGAVYSVLIGTGAVTDYVVLFDSGSTTGITSALQGSGGYKMRLYASSATQNTQYVFDPPLQFRNGIVAVNSSSVMTNLITYEGGRITAGY